VHVLSRLVRDEKGAVLVYVTVILSVLIGFGALVIDLGRLASLQTELQSFADHVALSAAGELDGNAGAIARASRAAALITADRQTFGSGAQALSTANDVAFRFLSSLPADDSAPITNAMVTTSDAAAAFVEVTVTPRRLDLWLMPAFAAFVGSNQPGSTTASAVAVAGLTEYVCDAAPLMMCSPDGATYTPVIGRQIQLVSQNSWGPGAFGFLDNAHDPDGPCGAPNQGAGYYRCVVAAMQNVTVCSAQHGVDIRPGRMTGSAADGFNTRFDMYRSNLSGNRNDALYAPSPNVVKGIGPGGGGQCISGSTSTYTDSVPLPRDSCFASGTCGNGGKFGNGIWDKAGYWAKNHGGTAPNVATRYDLYQYEIAHPASATRILPAPRQETGRPRCSNSTPAPPDRRVFLAAVIDCSTLPPGNASNVPVIKFTRLFMTEPAGVSGGGNDSSLWVEELGDLTGSSSSGTSGFVHDVVQLLR
jgi:Flp pilus assembly protein TadG